MLSKIFHKIKFDPYITTLTFSLLVFGFIIFFSAALGVMARNEVKFFSVIQNQFIFGIIIGSIAFFIASIFKIEYIKKMSPFIYAIGVILCILVFIPYIGMEHGGAKRWIVLAGFSMQPSEILKFASILLLGTYYTYFYDLKDTFTNRILPILGLSFFVLIVLKEPDLGTSTIILSGIFSVFFIIRAKWTDILIMFAILVPLLAGFYFLYPHAKERINTFLYPDQNSENQNYQVKQTRISIGSGGLWGDGYGQSIQKYHHLPEPIGDSIFAVIGEEFGFTGSVVILFLILFLGFRLIYISTNIRDPFGKAVTVGTGVVILVQTFLNAGSATGAIPFTGVPMPLISHGSTSIIITMAMLGLCSQISTKKHFG